MFPKVEEAYRPKARELVDDAASSICIDSQDYFELGEAIEVLQDQPAPQNDFERYNQRVARQIVMDWDYDASTIDLESCQDYDQGHQNPNDSPHIHYDDIKMMVLGGCASLTSMFEIEEAIARDGPVGSIIGCIIGFSLYVVSINGPMEMISFYPMDSYGGYVSGYIHASIGFALNCTYWWSCIATASQEAIVALLMLTQFKQINTPDINYVIWMVYLIFLMVVLHLTNRNLRLALASFCGVTAVAIIFTTIVMLILVTTGNLPPYYNYVVGKFFHEGCGGIIQNMYCAKFQPNFGHAAGASARYCEILDSTINAFRASGSVDKVYTLAYKVRNPRKSIPKTIKYSWARVAILFMVPTIALALGSAMNDPLYSSGKSVIAVKQFNIISDAPSPDSTATQMMCDYELSKWKHFENIRTFIPLSIPFIRANFCKINQFISASSIFFGVTACLWYLIAANETLTALLRAKPFSKWLPARSSHKKIASLKILNLSILVVHIVSCWWGLDSFYKFIAVAQTSYVFIHVGLLNISYVRFYKATQLESDGYIDRDDPHDWPYRAFCGKAVGCFCAFMSLLLLVSQWPLYAGAFDYWADWQFSASMFPLLLTALISLVHWLVYRPKVVRLNEIDLAGAKRSLDEQEWVEDRVFRKGAWARVYRWSGHFKYMILTPLKRAAQRGGLCTKPRKLKSSASSASSPMGQSTLRQR